jgi:hypothetical protein
MIREEDIIHESGKYWVLKTAQGYEVLKTGLTHSAVVGWFGGHGSPWVFRAIEEANRRNEADPEKPLGQELIDAELKRLQ